MIVIAGKNDIAVWGMQKFVALVGRENVGVVLNKSDDGINGWQKSLRYFANLKGVKVLSLGEAQLHADIFLSLEFDQLIDVSLFKTSSIYNMHFSLLPKYRGMYTSFWPILNAEKISGVTLHKIDNGIDTGPIVDQEVLAINHWTTSRDLYLAYICEAIKVLSRNIGKILDGQVKTHKQPMLGATYYSKKSTNFDIREIDCRKTADEVLRFIRAYSFREYQLPTFNGRAIVRGEILLPCDQQDSFAEEKNFYVVIQAIDGPVKLYFDLLDDLIFSCERNDLSAVRGLMKNIVSVNDKASNGWTPLIVACYHNSFEVVRYLVENGADIHAKGNNGTTVLMYAKDGALQTGDTSTFDFLVDLGCDVHAKDYFGKSLLDHTNAEDRFKLSLDHLLGV